MSVTLAFVLAIQARIPAECGLTHQCPEGSPGYYQLRKDALPIAQAIANGADNEEEAVEAAVYAAYESSNYLKAIGDSGRSHGAWQIQKDGLSADQQFSVWHRLRANSLAECSAQPDNEKLAQLASGSCHLGLKITRRRYAVVQSILAEMEQLD